MSRIFDMPAVEAALNRAAVAGISGTRAERSGRFVLDTDAEVEAAARADPDAQPMSDDRLGRARRVGLAGSLRFKLKLGRDEFCRRYRIPLGVLRGWERGTIEPDVVALAYLNVIAADPEGVAKTLGVRGSPLAAE